MSGQIFQRETCPMKPGARIAAAIEVLDAILVKHQPASTALSDWGKAHRFAGSGDRSAIGNLVYDALRHKSSIAHRFSSDMPRALALGAATTALGLAPDAIAEVCDGSKHAPEPLTQNERDALDGKTPKATSDDIAADIPTWLLPAFRKVFAGRPIAEGKAMAERAPIDLRVNTIRATREQVLAELSHTGAVAGTWAPNAIRIPAPKETARAPNVEAEGAHGRGWFEIQDEGSQIAAAFAQAKPSERILDLCAGAGGKTLALAASMQNIGEIVAYDADKARLRPIFERITRAGTSIVNVLRAGDEATLADYGPSFHCVLVDAPCSGSGTWRRKPDAKWRLKADSLGQRTSSQMRVLDTAARHVRPGGRLVYITCSILPEENTGQIDAFLKRHQDFQIVPWRDAWMAALPTPPPERSADGRDDTLLLTPASHGTDGFFIASLRRA